MRLAWVAAVAVLGCGRVAFDPLAGDAPGADALQVNTSLDATGAGADWARGVTQRPDGSFVIVGHIGGARVIGGQSVPFVGGTTDVVILSLDARGQIENVRSFGGTGFETATAATVDGDGNLYVVGTTGDSTDFGAGPVSSQLDDAYVVSFTAAGALRWLRLIGGNVTGGGKDAAFAVALQGQNVIVGGAVAGAVDFGGGATPAGSPDGRDGFVAAYNADDGAYRWAFRFGSSGSNTIFGVHTNDDTIAVGGAFDGTTTFLGQPIAVSGGSTFTDAVVATLTPTGSLRWVRTYGGPDSELAHDVAVTSNGGIYAVGRLGGDLATPMALAIPAASEGIIVRYAGDGTLDWLRVLGLASGCARLDSVVVTETEVVAAGTFSGSVATTETTITAVGAADGLAIGYSHAGEARWAGQAGTATDDIFTGLAGTQRGALLAVGSSASDVDTNCGGVSSGEEQDLMVRSF